MGRTHDLGTRGPGGVVTAGPWNGRDSYIAETAVTLDRLTAKIERLERREEALKAQVSELLENAQQATRFQALAESLRNSRDYKLDEMIRQVKDVRARVDGLEGPRTDFNGLMFKNLVAIERKLVALTENQVRQADRAGRLQPASVMIGILAVGILVSFAGLVF